jgi:tRNA uridine 5-carbamoylmethylation protein Kti12
MTSEQRLDRLERIAKLFVRAGLRERSNRRELDEKINIIVNAQIDNEERFAKLSSEITRSHNELALSLSQSHNELAQSLNELAKAQTRTENRLDSLIDIVKQDRNGNSG